MACSFISFFKKFFLVMLLVSSAFIIDGCSTVKKGNHHNKMMGGSSKSSTTTVAKTILKSSALAESRSTVVVDSKKIIAHAHKAAKPVKHLITANQATADAAATASAAFQSDQDLIQQANLAIKANQEEITNKAPVQASINPSELSDAVVKQDVRVAQSSESLSVFHVKPNAVKNILTGLFIAFIVIPLLIVLFMWVTNRDIKAFSKR